MTPASGIEESPSHRFNLTGKARLADVHGHANPEGGFGELGFASPSRVAHLLPILPDIKVRPTLCRTSSSTRKNTADGLPWLTPRRSIRGGEARFLRQPSKAHLCNSIHQEGLRQHFCRV